LRILVTGAAGFIGSVLVEAATKAGHYVAVMDKKWESSTAEPGYVEHRIRQHNIDIIVHLGASCSSQLSIRDPESDFTDNVVGTFRVCEAARKFDLPVIFNSTMKVVRGRDGKITPYGESKLFGERYLDMYRALYGIGYVINRPSSVYGPGQVGTEDGGWVTHFMRCALQKKPIFLWAPRDNSRDVLYVDDHVRLLLDQVENFPQYANRTFSSGGGSSNELSIGELLDWLEKHVGTVIIKSASMLPGDVPRVVNSNADVTAVNGWKPEVHWTVGLTKTLEWMKNVA
jgi:nucleoside-diphosphate-sugar epimerase